MGLALQQRDVPGFAGVNKKLHDRGIKFLGYINPYLVNDGQLYEEGKKLNVFAKRSDGSDYLVDFGEYYCGVIDLTDEKAYSWFRDEVIIKHSINIGIDGWMADFGEYLPVDDIVLSSGKSPMIEHNHWPVLWAECNYDALKKSGKLGDVVYFMRAGGTGTQKFCTLLWAGDQSVDFSRHDGLGTVICAALSSGMIGCGLTHSDIGGYTSLYGNVRTKELFLRWAEMAAFTPVMRTHEGNRPSENFQYYESDKNCYDEQYEYLLGSDVLVAPVYLAEKDTREVYLPAGDWINIWDGEHYDGGNYTVKAELGNIPVFYKANSEYAEIFAEITKKYGQ